MMSKDITARDCMGFSVYQGWMAITVLLVKNINLSVKRADVFRIEDTVKEEFDRCIGQFYEMKTNLLPKEVHIAGGMVREIIDEYLPVEVVEPKRGQKKEMGELAKKNAEIALKNKFEIIEKDEARTIGAIESLGVILNIETPIRSEALYY